MYYDLLVLDIPFGITNRAGLADRNASIVAFIASAHPNESRAITIVAFFCAIVPVSFVTDGACGHSLHLGMSYGCILIQALSHPLQVEKTSPPGHLY